MFLYHRQYNCSTSIKFCINSSVKSVTESTMTKISLEMSMKIRSLWIVGHHFSDIRTFLMQSGVHVSSDTIRRHCRLRRQTTATKIPSVLKVTGYV